jgi:hypothetical protein
METTLSPRRPSNLYWNRFAAAPLLVLALAGLVASPALALSIGGIAPSGGGIIYVAPPDPCLPAPQILSFTAGSSSNSIIGPRPQPPVTLGNTVPLSWNVQVPDQCIYNLVLVGSGVAVQGLATQGTLAVSPVPDQAVPDPTNPNAQVLLATFTLLLSWGQTSRVINTIQVAVDLPADPINPGRQLVTIGPANSSVPLFVVAVGTPNTTVVLQNQLELDLSNQEFVQVAAGVWLAGQRVAVPGQPYQPGPRLYTTTFPESLFLIAGDNVHISGVRIEGPGSPPDAWRAKVPRHQCPNPPGCAQGYTKGIMVGSEDYLFFPINVQIDHNELYNWDTSAVDVRTDCWPVPCNGRIWNGFTSLAQADPLGAVYPSVGIVYPSASEPIYIHDNYFHDNYWGDPYFGYGVSVGNSHALIERNVFDGHYHAIAGGNDAHTGYRAYRNLVLTNGHTNDQQFDMHGTDYCIDSHDECGMAGHDMDVRYNSFLWTGGPAIRVRGTPWLLPVGAVVESNVFAVSDLFYAVQTNGAGLLVGTPCIGGICEPGGNKMGVTTYPPNHSCDFDGDGINDDFIATGQTLWYRSGDPNKASAPWVYLNSTTTSLDQLSLGHFSGGPECDVVDGNLISVGGSGPWKLMLQNLRAQ